MTKGLRYILLALILALSAARVSAQFYSWGADPESLRWRKMKGDKISVIYPDTSAHLGHKLFHYTHTIQKDIGFGFNHGPMNIPFVIHPENARSNGLVMWLPKRVEILSSPAVNGYSMPWLKQLAAHEYRHAVQYNNLNRGVVRVFSYILGQQSSTIGLLFMPLWGLEGDATLSETQMSSFGRALQPSFTIDYRAAGRDVLRRKNSDKWFCGSYREHIPDHYHIGYQVTAYADTKYDENIWNKITRYAVRNPYVFATTAVAMKRYYNTSTNRLVRETFNDLNDYWERLPKVEDSSERLPMPAQRSFTTYRYPMALDADRIISYKESLDTTGEFVLSDLRDNTERRICRIGDLSTRPTLAGGRLWWTEYRRSLLYAERVNSKLCYVDIDRHLTRSVHKFRNALYPTAISERELAWVEYDPSGIYSVVRGYAPNPRYVYGRTKLPADVEIHSLAWDNRTAKLYFIATSDDGMWIGSLDGEGNIASVTKPAYITISDLRAGDGVLYFGSIASGKDEVHCLDLASGTERRISTSTYGSFSPSPAPDGGVLMTTYHRGGYALARQRVERDTLPVVAYSRLPENVVNPPRKQWNLINLDSVRFTAADSAKVVGKGKPRRFIKSAHLFNVHSWAPASYDPFALTEEGALDFNLGATIMSQSILSTMEGFLTWGWNRDEGSFYKASVRYYGLGVNLGVSASYGGRQRLYTVYSYERNPQTGQMELVFPEEPKRDKYYNIQVSALLPLYMQSGYLTHNCSISAVWNFSNGLVARMNRIKYFGGNISNIAKIGFVEGLHSLQFGASYGFTSQLAHKDFLPRWGYSLSANFAFNPADSKFSNLVALYSRAYLPGVVRHHSLSLAAAYQTSIGGYSSDRTIAANKFTAAQLLPHGYSSAEISSDNYFACSLNYQLPVWYPEGGIPTVIYFKRVRVNIGADFASFDSPYFVIYPMQGNRLSVETRRNRLWAYGGDVTVDMNLFRMPAAATTSLTISVYKPKNKSVFVSAGLNLPF